MKKFLRNLVYATAFASLCWSTIAYAATEAEKAAAIQKGLAHLAATQQPGGYWNYGGYEQAATGASVSAFLSQQANWGSNAGQYQAVVDNAIAYLLANASTMSVSTRNDGVNICPGGSASCTGVYWYGAGESTYTTGLVASAVDLYGVTKGASAVATTAGPLANMTWSDIAQGITNEFAASQSSAVNGDRDGGWRYYIPGNGDSDSSTTQWAVISMIYDQTLGAVTPQTVIDHLKNWLIVAQVAGQGGAGCYQPDYLICEPSDTGSLLIGLKFTGSDLNNSQVGLALGFLNTDWASTANGTWYGNIGQPYAMWAVYKALEINIGLDDNAHILNRYTDCGASRGALPGSGLCNWWEDYNEWLEQNQNPGGDWSGYAYWTDPLSTAFSVSILGATQIPQITAPCLVINAMQGTAITPATMQATGGAGGPYTYSATGLPAGLTMSSTGVISGTPTVSGTFNYTVTITDEAGNAGKVTCTIVVLAQITAPCPAISAQLGKAIVPVTLQPSGGAGGPYTFSATGLPTNLVISQTGTISGTPTANGTFNYTVTIMDSAGNVGTVHCSITVGKDIWAATPTFSPGGGTYTSVQMVTISDSTPGAKIYYTMDGSWPTANSTPFSLPIYIGGNTTLRAIAIAAGYQNSLVASAIYHVTLPPAATPTFSPGAGKYIGSVMVTIGDTTPSAIIHYTLNGSKPSSSSPVYAGPITVTKYTVIRAIATAPNFWTSAVAQAGYSITPQAPTPVISPASGACSAGQMITITDSDAHATIRYTVDGSTPNPHSTLYTHPFPMTCNETVEAIAIDCNVAASAVAIATY